MQFYLFEVVSSSKSVEFHILPSVGKVDEFQQRAKEAGQEVTLLCEVESVLRALIAVSDMVEGDRLESWSVYC